MRSETLFLSGVHESVLQETLLIQAELPEQILYLQPYSGERIARLSENPPTADRPMRVFISVTRDLAMVCYTGELVGWEDKRRLGEAKKRALNRVIWALQPNEGGLYERARPDGPDCTNLLFLHRLKVLSPPFPVNQLTKLSDGQPLSPGRTTAGGWSYVANQSVE